MTDLLPERTADLVFESQQDLAEITRFAGLWETFAQKANLADGLVYQINLAVDEWLSNVIRYGFPEGRTFWAQISLWVTPDQIVLLMEDRGIAFDPLTDATKPDTELDIEEREIGGLGIHFVREMMDETIYQRTHGCNRLILKKRYQTDIEQD